MLEYLKAESNLTLTENGAATYRSTGSECLDLFASIGALRHAEDRDVLERFIRAYTEDADVAMKILFYARDVRGGLGERKVFRIILKWLANNEPNSVRKNVALLQEYGRWDDLLVLLGTSCEADAIRCIELQLHKDLEALKAGDEEVSLLGKWLPSVNASNPETVRSAKTIARALKMSDAQYRKALVALRARIRIIENYLRTRDYSFDYAKQPSKAMFKYREAFIRNDNDRYAAFLNKVESGEASMHTGTLMPYEIVEPLLSGNFASRCFVDYLSEEQAHAVNTTWNALPDYTNGENALAVVDTSGSMYWARTPMPAAVALSLGLYFAERSKGAFANHFIEFSNEARLIEIKGETFYDRLRYLGTFNDVANTDLNKVFDLILNAAVKNHVLQEELPKKLYLISDMEFDQAVTGADVTNFEAAKKRFEAAGYTLPEVVFWNVDSRNQQQPVQMNEAGVMLVSGCTPRIFSMVMDGIITPYLYMMSVIGSERYSAIAA